MTPLVLLPGMMCDARVFAPQIAGIRDRAVMVAPITGADTAAALARDVLAHAPPRFALAGHSMGGIVAMEVLSQLQAEGAPERVAGLCLMSTNPKAEHPGFAAGREPQIARVEAGGLRAVMREALLPHYLAAGSERGDILDTCMAMAGALGPEVFVRQSRALQTRADQQEALRAVAVPSLVLCGREDAICPLSRHEGMHALIAGSRLAVIEGAGHMPTLEAPEAVTALLREWLAAVDAA